MNPIALFRLVAIAEGISYLALLGIAMPIKHLYGHPEAVKIPGSIHGGLFVLYLITTFLAAWAGKWSWGRIAEAVGASLLPFGPFYLEYKYKTEFSSQAATKQPTE